MDPGWKKRIGSGLALLLFVLVLARTVRQAQRAPVLNWDMLPAMALALEWSESDPLEVQRRTYEAARAELGPEVFRELTAPGVRQARLQDPAAFHEHLPFYRARVLYTLAIAALHALGTPLAAATWWIPLAAYALSAALLFLWTARHLGPALGALLALGLAHLPALLSLATYSTADGLALLLVLAGAWFLIEHRSFWPGASCFVLAIGARPDTVLLVGFLALATHSLCAREERPPLRALALWLGLGAGSYLALARFAGEYGWWPLFTISFDEKAVHPAALPTAVDWGRYGEILARQLAALPGDGYTRTPREVTGSTLVFPCAALALLGLALWRRSGPRYGREAALLAALLATYSLRYLLFPQLWDRFFAAFYLLVPLCLLSMVAGELRRSPVAAAPDAG